jgi:hypothetical protein
MIEEEATGVVAIAEAHRQAALRIEAGVGGSPFAHAPEVGGWLELVHVRLDAATASELQFPEAIEATLSVSVDWLRAPIPAPQPETHRVEIGPSDATETSVSVLGTTASASVTWSLPFADDLARAGVRLERQDQYTLDDVLLLQSPDCGTAVHQFLGFADPLQGDLWESLASDLTLCAEVDRLALLQSARHRLLFQIDSDPDNDFMIGDLGRLYVLVPSDDLVDLRGDRTLALVQMS